MQERNAAVNLLKQSAKKIYDETSNIFCFSILHGIEEGNEEQVIKMIQEQGRDVGIAVLQNLLGYDVIDAVMQTSQV